jgi:sarcosine oxidase, subunit beta
MSDKAIVCACEDVTRKELEDAIRLGHGDVESMKRYTGLGTGPCQGKSCLVAAMRLCAESARLPPAARVPFRARPPLFPTALSAFAGLPDEIVRRRDSPPLPPKAAIAAHPLQSREPLPTRSSVVIVGGGIMGLALAWNLAGRGESDVLVLERGYLCEGASGRNGGGVRAQFSTPSHIELAKESIDFMGRFAQELGINVWLRRGGYLFLAKDRETLRLLENGARLHRAHGLATRIIDAGEAGALVPQLDTSKFIAASWNPDDGVVFPWPFLWGYADGARKRGVRVEVFTRVTGLDVEAGAIRAVRTDRGTVRADRVVIACGAWSPSVAAMAGVALPNVPYRHEIVSSEPLKPFLGPLVTVLGSGLYFSQSMRGEIVGGMGDPGELPGLDQTSSLRFLVRYARALTDLVPRLGQVKLLRQWAGCYDVTPDHSPILGETPGVRGLLQMSGFVGHGFMMAPAVARRMAAWMGGEQDELFDRFNVSRFAEGRLERETLIIG